MKDESSSPRSTPAPPQGGGAPRDSDGMDEHGFLAHDREHLLAAERAARARAESLQALTAALARAATVPEVVTAAVNEGRRTVGSHGGAVALLDDSGSTFTLVAGPGITPDAASTWASYPNAGNGPAPRAVRTAAPVYSRTREEYTASGPGFTEVAEHLNIWAEATLPLTVAGRVLGALSFIFDRPRDFTADDDALLRAVTDQCAQALERVRLLDAERTSREQTERLQHLTAALSQALTPADVVHVAVEQGLRAFDADAGLVMLCSDAVFASGDEEPPATDALTLIESTGYPPAHMARWQHVPVDAPIPVAVSVREARTVVVRSREERAARFPAVARELSAFNASVTLPLTGHGRVIGALGVNWVQVRDLGPSKIAFMEAFAWQCGQALERARLHADAERARQAAEASAAALEETRRSRDAALLAGEIGTFTWDIVHQRVWGDTNFGRMFGIALDADGQAPLDRYIDVIHPADRDRMRANVARTVEDGADYEIEYRVVADDGSVRWLLVRAKPERDHTGRVVRAPGVCLDVTGRRQAEEALRQSTTLLQAITDATGDVIYAKDLDGRLTYGNPATFALIGRPADEALGRTDAEFLSDPDAARHVMENDRRIITSGRAEEVEEAVPLPDGAERVWASYKMPYRDEHGAVIGLLGVSRDVTARKKAERALESILLSIDDGLIVVDREWRFTYFSDRAVQITGATREDMLGHVVWDMFPHAQGTRFFDGFHDAVRTGQPVHFEEFYPDPIDKWIECHCYPGPEGLTVFFRDVSDRKQADVERERLLAIAEEANRAKAVFLANMSHELRTPLNAIGGHVQLIELGLHGPVTPAQEEALGRVRRAQRHLLALINDVLNYAKLEAGKVEFDVQPIRVGDVVADVVSLLEPLVRAKGLVLDAAPQADAEDLRTTRVLTDREKLAQALLNLLENAIKFTPAVQADGSPGRITVGLQIGDATDQLHVQVQDTGIGIASDKLDAIFDPFVQVSEGHSRSHEGTGLGLAISRDVVRGMGGELTVQSTVGVGSTFTLSLPLVR